jgi:hypothetical protein
LVYQGGYDFAAGVAVVKLPYFVFLSRDCLSDKYLLISQKMYHVQFYQRAVILDRLEENESKPSAGSSQRMFDNVGLFDLAELREIIQ